MGVVAVRNQDEAAGPGSNGGKPETGIAADRLWDHLTRCPQHSATANRLFWDDLPLSAGDAIRGHWYCKSVFPGAPAPLERFALGPSALLVAQSWAIPDTPYLPSTSWWRKLQRVSDRALARIVSRVSGLVEGRPAVLDRNWRRAWRELLLPGLLAEVKRRRQQRSVACFVAGPPLDVLETMRGLTHEDGHRHQGEVWFHCPFHADSTPSLSVNVDRQVWHCFGCQRGGGWKTLREMSE